MNPIANKSPNLAAFTVDRPQNLNLAIIGNCAINAHIDEDLSIVFGCWPRPDQDLIFSSLLHGGDVPPETVSSFDFLFSDCNEIAREYLPKTAVLRSVVTDARGNCAEVLDFVPRFQIEDGIYAPRFLIRIVRPLIDVPGFRVRCNPRFDYNGTAASIETNHQTIDYSGAGNTLRLVSSAPIDDILGSKELMLDRPYVFLFGMDVPDVDDAESEALRMLTATMRHWESWVDSLQLPDFHRALVVRSAIALKMCWHQETGAILAALTMGLPAEDSKNRSWDYRFCWLRDASYVAESLFRLGDREVILGYREFLRPLLKKASKDDIQCMFALDGSEELTEERVDSLAGYRGLGPVLKGNEAADQTQLDCFGHVLNIFALLALAEGRCDADDLSLMIDVAENAYRRFQEPDSGFWELRGVQRVHTYSAIISWRAMDSIVKVLDMVGSTLAASVWRLRRSDCRNIILSKSWSDKEAAFAGFFGGDALDVTVLHMSDIRMISASDPRLASTLEAMERRLRRDSYLLPYDEADDFGVRKCGFNLCTFWFINTLFRIGRRDEARQLLEEMLDCCNDLGYMSEVIEPNTKELWGNFPQAYSHIGIIEAVKLLASE